jgi:hypothetical protein
MPDAQIITEYGKFEGELLVTKYAHDLVGEGWADDEDSLEDTGEWWAIVTTDKKYIQKFRDVAESYDEELSSGDVAFLKSQVGVIIEGDEMGNVRGHWYDDKKLLKESWKNVVEELEEQRQPDILELTYDENTGLVYDDSGRTVWPHTPSYTEWRRFAREYLTKYDDEGVDLYVLSELGKRSEHPLTDREIEELLAA